MENDPTNKPDGDSDFAIATLHALAGEKDGAK